VSYFFGGSIYLVRCALPREQLTDIIYNGICHAGMVQLECIQQIDNGIMIYLGILPRPQKALQGAATQIVTNVLSFEHENGC